MHGLGNDFIIVDGFRQHKSDIGALAKRLCDRHFGIGADGLILALPSDLADARMRIFNADGGEPEMCGNGIRCLGKFLYDNGICRRESMAIETLAGVLALEIEAEGGAARRLTVDMGAPIFDPAKIPVDAAVNRVTLDAAERRVGFFCVSMGNPHAVTFDLYPDREDFLRLGAIMERHPLFPRRANIEFCRTADFDASGAPHGAEVRVWERGDGETLACGTGACAAVIAAVENGLCDEDSEVRVSLLGGELSVRYREGRVLLTGGANKVYEGSFAY